MMFDFSVDYLTGQVATGRKNETCQSDEESLSPRDSTPSPLSSDDGSRHFSDSLSPGSDKPPTYRHEADTENRPNLKPPHSYIALISMAILSTDDKRMMLSDIYNYIMEKFPYYNNKDKAWRNSIRHNLSLNECFIKSGRADNGKGNFWSIHPACIDDFARGDFRRRQARRRARKSSMTRDASVSNLPLTCMYNLGYVPMTSSTIGSSAYRPCLGQASAYLPQAAYSYPVPTAGVSQRLYTPYQSQPTAYSSSLTTPGLHMAPTSTCDQHSGRDFAYTPISY